MNATAIIDKMYNNDTFSQWLGIERLEERKGYCKLKMQVREKMCNGFGIAHGGITYSFADSALAFASNSNGMHALTIESSISHLKPLYPGDTIFATCCEQSLSNQIGVYEVKVAKETGELVALLKGTVFRKNIEWQ